MPVYNCEGTLNRAVDSVLNQNYENIELILVDDGAVDNSGKLADEIMLNNPYKITVIHQENKGQGGARNEGVKLATGDYLLFVDSDDEIESDLVSFCVERLENENADVIFFEYAMLNQKGELQKNVLNPFNFSESENLRENNSYLLLQGLACNRMYNLDFYKKSGITFREKIRYEDLLLSSEILYKAQKIIYTKRPLYKYYLSQNSAMRNSDIERNKEIFFVMDTIFNYFKENEAFDTVRNELCYLTVDNVYIATSLRLIRMRAKYKHLKQYRSYLKQTFPDYAKNKYLKKMSKQYKLTFKLLQFRLYFVIKLLTLIKDKRG